MKTRHGTIFYPYRFKELLFISFLTIWSAGGSTLSISQEIMSDIRSENLRGPNQFKPNLHKIDSLKEWQERKKELREMILLSAGLWPEPKKTPLHAHIFDERSGDGFTVAKVYFESLPGFLATGTLYRPTEGTKPYPAVLTPHGHWEYGRLQNSPMGSIVGRCIDFARQGFVIFSIDMVGYNDSFQLPHDPNKSRAQLKADIPEPYERRFIRADFNFPEAEMYGFSLGGLQLWNNIRAVDFLTSLPDVDPKRIGVTGASGGATQTLLLMTADERIKVAAPVNIIGAARHPGCLCENISQMWIETSTVEMAAAFAPKPLLLMSATEDPWTNKTPEREYPLIKHYYSLYNAENMIKNVHITAGHNYNAETRASVYKWFCKHLKSQFPPIENPSPVSDEAKHLGDLRVFPDKLLPDNAVSGTAVINYWKNASESAFAECLPLPPNKMKDFITTYRKMLNSVLILDNPSPDELEYRIENKRNVDSITHITAFLGRKGEGDCFAIETAFSGDTSSGTVVMVYPEDRGGLFFDDSTVRQHWVDVLIEKGYRIIRVRGYASGNLFIPQKEWDSYNWSNAYNRDNNMNGIQDIVTALHYVKNMQMNGHITVVGLGQCGLLSAFACATTGIADRVIIDLNRSDPGYDRELVNLLPVGSIKRVGDFRTAMLLLMQKPVTVFNSGPTFNNTWYSEQARTAGFNKNVIFDKSVTGLNFIELF